MKEFIIMWWEKITLPSLMLMEVSWFYNIEEEPYEFQEKSQEKLLSVKVCIYFFCGFGFCGKSGQLKMISFPPIFATFFNESRLFLDAFRTPYFPLSIQWFWNRFSEHIHQIKNYFHEEIWFFSIEWISHQWKLFMGIFTLLTIFSKSIAVEFRIV